MAVASELEESTRILHKSVRVLLQNINISVGLSIELIEIVVGCGGERKVKIVLAEVTIAPTLVFGGALISGRMFSCFLCVFSGSVHTLHMTKPVM